jgi:hypothetical protein
VQSPGRHPVDGFYPINAWHSGQVVADYHLFHIKPEVPPGEYRLQAGWTLAFDDRALAAEQATIATIRVLSNPDWKPTPQHKQRARFANELELLGFDLQGRPVPGRRLKATLYWRAAKAADHLPITLTLTDGSDKMLSSSKQILADWPQGEAFPLPFTLDLPSDVNVSSADLGVYTSPQGTDGGSGWKKPATALDLTTIDLQVPPSTPGTQLGSSFDDLAMLLSYNLTEQVTPGGTVRVTLYWWAMSPMDEDYTVFVHLLDDNGRVKWQQDIMPVFGTRPTSGWRPGQVLEDVHDIPLSADAPEGLYRVEIGIYSPLTWQRLHVLDPNGDPQADHLFLDPVQVVR